MTAERDGTQELDAHDAAAALRGDRAAFARIVDRHQPFVARILWRFSREKRVLEELVQDTFVESYFSLAKYRGHGPFAAWLRTIATRVGYGHWKTCDKLRQHDVSCRIDLDQLEANITDPDEATEILDSVLSKLPARDRLVLTVLYLDGASVSDAAASIGWSETMVRVQAHRARKKLKQLIGREQQ